jgi:hypothetical protein
MSFTNRIVPHSETIMAKLLGTEFADIVNLKSLKNDTVRIHMIALEFGLNDSSPILNDLKNLKGIDSNPIQYKEILVPCSTTILYDIVRSFYGIDDDLHNLVVDDLCQIFRLLAWMNADLQIYHHWILKTVRLANENRIQLRAPDILALAKSLIDSSDMLEYVCQIIISIHGHIPVDNTGLSDHTFVNNSIQSMCTNNTYSSINTHKFFTEFCDVFKDKLTQEDAITVYGMIVYSNKFY